MRRYRKEISKGGAGACDAQRGAAWLRQGYDPQPFPPEHMLHSPDLFSPDLMGMAGVPVHFQNRLVGNQTHGKIVKTREQEVRSNRLSCVVERR